jgi:glycosyltransferase involved in cell wall biosynthesis
MVNNNSTDATLILLKDYESAYPDKIFVHNEYKKGAPAARNFGLHKAKGEWVQFLDADDELLSNKLQIQYDIARGTNADIIAGSCLLKYNKKGKTTSIIRHVDKNPWQGLITSNLGITSSNLWRKEALLNVNGWDESVTSSQEYDLLFRLLKNKSRILNDDSINTVIHFSDNSISKSENKEKMILILDNRVDLRLNIKRYLESSELLTHELASLIDTYIYTEIMRYYCRIPGHAKKLLKNYPLRVKTSRVLKIWCKVLIACFRDLTGILC